MEGRSSYAVFKAMCLAPMLHLSRAKPFPPAGLLAKEMLARGSPQIEVWAKTSFPRVHLGLGASNQG